MDHHGKRRRPPKEHHEQLPAPGRTTQLPPDPPVETAAGNPSTTKRRRADAGTQRSSHPQDGPRIESLFRVPEHRPATGGDGRPGAPVSSKQSGTPSRSTPSDESFRRGWLAAFAPAPEEEDEEEEEVEEEEEEEQGREKEEGDGIASVIKRIHSTADEDDLIAIEERLSFQLDDSKVQEALDLRRALFWTVKRPDQFRSTAMLNRAVSGLKELKETDCGDAIAALEKQRESLSRSSSTSCTLETLKLFFESIDSSTDEGEDGCERRAHQICELLLKEHPEIAIHNLTKAWTYFIADRPLHLMFKWAHHVAPCVATTQGMYVLDPILYPDGPARLEDWLNGQGRSIGEYRVSPWEIKGFPARDDVVLDIKSMSDSAA